MAALALLERDPDQPLTITRIAREVKAVPAALYRHFDSVDEMLDGVLAEILRDTGLAIRPRASWQGQVRDWMTSLRAHLIRYPAVLPLIGRHGRTSPVWLDAVAPLIAILERAGLGGREVAWAHLWILENTMGLVIQEATLSLPEQIANARSSLSEVSDETRDRFVRLLPHLERLDGDAFFAFATRCTIGAISTMIEPR